MSESVTFKARTCGICGRTIESLAEFMRVPKVDLQDVASNRELDSLIGQAVHSDCWSKSNYWPEVGRLAVAGFDQDFSSGIKIFGGEWVGGWKRRLCNVDVGLLYMPRSAVVFDGMFGIDVEGGAIGGSSIDLADFLSVLRDWGINGNSDASLSRDNAGACAIEPSGYQGRFFLRHMDGSADGGAIVACLQLEDIEAVAILLNEN